MNTSSAGRNAVPGRLAHGAPLRSRLDQALAILLDHGGLVLALFSMLLFLSQLHLSLLLAPLEPGILSVQLSFRSERFWSAIGQWGSDGLSLYRSHFAFDHLHALVYGAWGGLLVGMTRLFEGTAPAIRWRAAAMLPVAAVADLVENGLHLHLLTTGPVDSALAVGLACLASLVKWLLVLGFAAWVAWRLLRQFGPAVQQALALRVPPMLLAVLLAAALLVAARHWPVPTWADALPWPLTEGLAGMLALLGLATRLAARHEFKQCRAPLGAKRPLPPLGPSLGFVTSGVYALSRNPGCLGLALLIGAWALWLRLPIGMLGVPLFMAYVQQFQIRPEEAWLAEHFGPAFRLYCAEVPRWI